MTQNRKTHIKVADRFPEFFRDDYPLFVQFVEEYYKYLDTTFTGKIDEVKDIDLCDSVFLTNFKNQFCATLPEFTHFELRNFVKHARSFYQSKGTIDSVKFLFRILFNDEVEVYYPGDSLLRTSDGRWFQEYFITLTRIAGDEPDLSSETNVDLVFTNAYGTFQFKVTRTESISNLETRFYFLPETNYSVIPDQKFFVYRNNVEIYIGQLIKSPSHITIINPGKYWTIGKVFKIPGTGKDTICKVIRTDDQSGIASAEILEYGYSHSENQISTISPYKNRPTGSQIEYDKVLVSFSPLIYEHTLEINDFTDGSEEQFYGFGQQNTYLIDDYVETGYFGSVLFAQEIINNSSSTDQSLIDITIEQWLESRATLILNYDYVIKTKGYWTTESGLISNDSIRLQDNDVYQVFSYSIDTSKDIKEYSSVIQNIHPAGFRLYGNLGKAFEYKQYYATSRTISNDILFLSDSFTELSDSPMKYISKDLEFTLELSDPERAKTVEKSYTESFVISDSDSRSSNKPISDTITSPSDSYVSDINKSINDSTSTSESLPLSGEKILSDSTDLIDSDTPVQAFISYVDADYMDPSYFVDEITITI